MNTLCPQHVRTEFQDKSMQSSGGRTVAGLRRFLASWMQRKYKCKQKEAAKLKSGRRYLCCGKSKANSVQMRLENTSGETLPEKRFSPERGDLLGDHQVLR